MWLSVTLATDAAHAEALADALLALGALSVGMEDADAGTDRETPQFGEPGHLPTALWDHSRVIALFDGTADAQRVRIRSVDTWFPPDRRTWFSRSTVTADG